MEDFVIFRSRVSNEGDDSDTHERFAQRMAFCDAHFPRATLHESLAAYRKVCRFVHDDDILGGGAQGDGAEVLFGDWMLLQQCLV